MDHSLHNIWRQTLTEAAPDHPRAPPAA